METNYEKMIETLTPVDLPDLDGDTRNELLKRLYHKAWGQAQLGNAYDKRIWRLLTTILNIRGIDV